MDETEFKEMKAKLTEAVSVMSRDQLLELENILIFERWDRVTKGNDYGKDKQTDADHS